MINTATVLKGVVLGKTIQLEQEPCLPDGQHVQIAILPVTSTEDAGESRDGLKRAFGAWADEVDAVDEFLNWNRQQRKVGRAEISP